LVALPDSALALLELTVYGHVVTRNRDGTPQVTMVWVEADGGDLLFNTAEGRQKVRNLRRDPQIIVSVHDIENPQQYLLVQGTATISSEGADAQVDRLAKKYLGVDSYPWRGRGEQRRMVRVAIERIGGSGPWVAAS